MFDTAQKDEANRPTGVFSKMHHVLRHVRVCQRVFRTTQDLAQQFFLCEMWAICTLREPPQPVLLIASACSPGVTNHQKCVKICQQNMPSVDLSLVDSASPVVRLGRRGRAWIFTAGEQHNIQAFFHRNHPLRSLPQKRNMVVDMVTDNSG